MKKKEFAGLNFSITSEKQKVPLNQVMKSIPITFSSNSPREAKPKKKIEGELHLQAQQLIYLVGVISQQWETTWLHTLAQTIT